MRTLILFTLVCLALATTPTTLYELAMCTPPSPGIPKDGTWSAYFTVTPAAATLASGTPDLDLWLNFVTWASGRTVTVTWYIVGQPGTTDSAAISISTLTYGSEVNTTLSLVKFPACNSGCSLQLDFVGTCTAFSCINGISAQLGVRVFTRGTSPKVYAYDFQNLPYESLLNGMWTVPIYLVPDEYKYFNYNATVAGLLPVKKTTTSNILSSVVVVSGSNTQTKPTKSGNPFWVATRYWENDTFVQGVNYIGVYGDSSLFSGTIRFQVCIGNCPDAAATVVPLFALFALLLAHLF